MRLLRPDELPADWDPATDPRLTAWEIVHHLIRVLDSGGEGAAAELVAKLGAKAEVARELAYRLYTLCERKKRAAEALAYNGLVQSWPEITRLAREGGKPEAEQAGAVRGARNSHGNHQPRTRRQGAGLFATGSRPSSSASSRAEYGAACWTRGHDAASRDDRAGRARSRVAEWDVAALLKLMWEQWNEVFRETLGPPSAAWSASCATSATSGRTRSRSRATTPIARSTRSARLLTAVSAPQADEVEQDEDGAAPAHASTSRCAARSARRGGR